jgi:flagellar hook assembly protein FlgD
MGENKTDYLWNGRNAEGQSLSPGVYFYKVKAFVDGEPVPYQITDDRAGQHDRTGKLILVR